MSANPEVPLARRGFLALAAGATAGVLQARTLRTVGVQLYTVRSIIDKDPLAVLRAIQDIGYREVEAIGADLDHIWSALQQTSLKPVSEHLDFNLFLHKQDQLASALDKAKSHGFQYVVCPYIPPNERGGEDVMRKLGATLNKAGEQANRMGLQLCYHNHAFEYRPVGNGTLLDVLMQSTDPKLVALELDVMWAQVGGVDPVSILHKYASRVKLVHLKDVRAGIGPQYNENIPRDGFKEVGSGVVHIPEVLKAAAAAGVKHYFVEQDQTPGDPIASLRKSYEYLQKVNF